MIETRTNNLRDELRHQLRMIEALEFHRRELKGKIGEGGLAALEPGIKLNLQNKIQQIEKSRQDLRDTVEALVAGVSKSSLL